MTLNDSSINLSEGLGTGAFIFGAILIFFELIFLFIGMHLTGGIILLKVLFLKSYKKGIFIDINIQMHMHRGVIFYPTAR